MGHARPEITGRRDKVAPLLVRPRDAWKMLACGNTRGYELLAAGELEHFLDGRARKITVASIQRYIARRLAANGANRQVTPQSRRPSRPRKLAIGARLP
jgi:hypothetical protein